MRHSYGHVKDRISDDLKAMHPDIYRVKPRLMKAQALRNHIKAVDLRDQCPPVFDQLQLGSCTANALLGAYGFTQMKQNIDYLPMSRLYLYYKERQMEGTISEDSGAQIHDGVRSLVTGGVCSEDLMPYNIEQFALPPSSEAEADAIYHRILKAHIVPQNTYDIKQCLIEGNPVVFGFTVYESFESEETARTGIVQMPKLYEEILGGHAVVAVGFDDHRRVWIVRNSWSSSWGDQGYCYFPYEYLLDNQLASDFWTISSVTE